MRSVLVSSPKQLLIGQEEMVSSCIRGGLDWILGKISLLKDWSDIGIDCRGRWLSSHPWRC